MSPIRAADPSVLAEDEQRRSGHPESDVEHLFLALLSIGGPVTDALAAQGVTLAGARAAFAGLHARRTARLGVRMDESAESARRILDSNARGGFVYRDGVRKLLEDASNQKAPDTALFAERVGEPPGHIREVLRELEINPDHPALDIARTRENDTAGEHSLDYRRFVPASPDVAWALVSYPDRWLEWNGFEFERVEVTETGGFVRTLDSET